MVYVAPRTPQTPLQRANAMKRHAGPTYERTVRLLPAQQRDAIQAYVWALCAEAAARRTENDRLQAALDARTRGNHHTEGEQP